MRIMVKNQTTKVILNQCFKQFGASNWLQSKIFLACYKDVNKCYKVVGSNALKTKCVDEVMIFQRFRTSVGFWEFILGHS